MFMKKFIKGVFELENDTNLEEFEKIYGSVLNNIVAWAEVNGGKVTFRNSDTTYFCDFQIKCDKMALCKKFVTELKKMLKSKFPKAEIIFQVNGNSLCQIKDKHN